MTVFVAGATGVLGRHCQLKPFSGDRASPSGEHRHRVYDSDLGWWAESVIPGTKIVQEWRAHLY